MRKEDDPLNPAIVYLLPEYPAPHSPVHLCTRMLFEDGPGEDPSWGPGPIRSKRAGRVGEVGGTVRDD